MSWWYDFWHPVSQPFFYSLYHCDCDARRPKDYWEVWEVKPNVNLCQCSDTHVRLYGHYCGKQLDGGNHV